jgi:hypothetical protein
MAKRTALQRGVNRRMYISLIPDGAYQSPII